MKVHSVDMQLHANPKIKVAAVLHRRRGHILQR